VGTSAARKGTIPELLNCSLRRCTDKQPLSQIGGLLLRLVVETAMVKVPGKVRAERIHGSLRRC
jgi:hypothetical protein